MHNAKLLLAGYANALTIPPNVRYADMFVQFEREARAASRGLWGLGHATGVTIARVDLVGEVVVIRNDGTTAVDMSNWALVSENGNQKFVFPCGTVIQAGASLSIVSGRGATEGAGRLVWTKSRIWNDKGDPAVLLDANNVEVSRR